MAENPILGGFRLAMALSVAAAALTVLVTGMLVEAAALIGIVVSTEGLIALVARRRTASEPDVAAQAPQ